MRTFFIKRSFRILPLYWLVVAIYFAVPAFHEREALPPLWKFLTFTQNFLLDLSTSGTFSHAWSLCVEEHFYLLLPLILVLLSRSKVLAKGTWLLLFLFLSGLAIRHYEWTRTYATTTEMPNSAIGWYTYIYYPTYNRLDGLLTGVSIAALYTYAPVSWGRIARYGNWALLLGLVILAGAYHLCYDEHSYAASVFGFPMVAIGYCMLVIGAVSPSCVLYKWSSRVTTLIATLSYGIYLTHKGVIHITQAALHGIDANSGSMMVICVLACVFAALVLNIVIERPFLRFRDRVLEKEKN